MDEARVKTAGFHPRLLVLEFGLGPDYHPAFLGSQTSRWQILRLPTVYRLSSLSPLICVLCRFLLQGPNSRWKCVNCPDSCAEHVRCPYVPTPLCREPLLGFQGQVAASFLLFPIMVIFMKSEAWRSAVGGSGHPFGLQFWNQ